MRRTSQGRGELKYMCANRRECAESLDKLAHSTYQTRTAQTVTSGMQSAVLSRIGAQDVE
jgi:hypothetical protein